MSARRKRLIPPGTRVIVNQGPWDHERGTVVMVLVPTDMIRVAFDKEIGTPREGAERGPFIWSEYAVLPPGKKI